MSSSTETGETKVAKLRQMNDLWRTQLRSRVLTYIQEWAFYGHLEYFESWSKRSQLKRLRIKKCSNGIRTPSIGSYVAITRTFSIKRETARSLYGNAHAGQQAGTVREKVGWT